MHEIVHDARQLILRKVTSLGVLCCFAFVHVRLTKTMRSKRVFSVSLVYNYDSLDFSPLLL